MKNSSAFSNRFFCLLALATFFTLTACKDDDKLETLFGDSQTIGSGLATAYLVNKNDTPTEIGIVMSEATYLSLDSNYQSLSLNFPTSVNQTPFVHALFDWAPFGHEPANVYTLPHFDLHFYMTSAADRVEIGVEDSVAANILPDASFFPPDYFPTGVVPYMGNHWIDAKAAELDTEHPHTFDETFIYGSFNGEVTFWEPMITKDYVESENDFVKAIPQPAEYNEPGKYYPTSFGFDR